MTQDNDDSIMRSWFEADVQSAHPELRLTSDPAEIAALLAPRMKIPGMNEAQVREWIEGELALARDERQLQLLFDDDARGERRTDN